MPPLDIKLDDVSLTQAQLDVVTPILNERMGGARMSDAKFKQRVKEALASAGMPLPEKK